MVFTRVLDSGLCRLAGSLWTAKIYSHVWGTYVILRTVTQAMQRALDQVVI